MLETEQPSRAGLTSGDKALNNTSDCVKSNVNELFTQCRGSYYVTPEMTRELKHIDYGADHIRLDNDFLRSSTTWGTKLNDPAVVAQDQAGATQALSKAATIVRDVKDGSTTERILSMQDNQVRQHHHDSINNLRHAQQEMAPYAHLSIDRVRQFCDHIGVTDRYTGYRNNLNRGQRDPYNRANHGSYLGQSGRLPAHLVPRSSSCVGNLPHVARSKTCDRVAASAPTGIHAGPHTFPLGTIQERCGIIVKYPGTTEYHDRYITPERGPNFSYCINPSPDYTVTGRPLARNAHRIPVTEYKGRYTWPDGSSMSKLPWIRK